MGSLRLLISNMLSASRSGTEVRSPVGLPPYLTAA